MAQKQVKLISTVIMLSLFCHGQVALMPPPKVQFFSGSVPVAGGCIGTYQSGTLTPLATFTDNTGLFQNSNPVTLDANGMAPIWLSSSNVYRIVVYSAPSFPFNCSNGPGPQLYVTDGVVGVGGGGGSGGTSLLSSNNTWTGSNSFSGAVTFSSSLVAPKLGPSIAQQHTIPAVASDTYILANATQTLTNKTLTSPSISSPTITGTVTLTSPLINNPTVNSVFQPGVPGTYMALLNDTSTGTTVNLLSSLTSVGAAIKTTAGATNGVIGICVSGCGLSGSGIIQSTGLVSCQFDGSASGSDYVQISTGTAGDCHDTGVTTYPAAGGQVIGKVVGGGAGAGLYTLLLYSPEIQPVQTTLESTMTTSSLVGSGTAVPGGASGANPVYNFVNARTIEQWTLNVVVAPVGCTTNATVGIRDLTSSTTLASSTPTITGITTSTINVGITATHNVALGVITSSSGCSTAMVFSISATYK